MTTATGRVQGWDDRDEPWGPTLEGYTEYITGNYEQLWLPNPFGKKVLRHFINGVGVEADSVIVHESDED